MPRMSGLMCILSCIENIHMVRPGGADPNIISVHTVLSMNHKPLSEEHGLYQVCSSVTYICGSHSPSFFTGHHLEPVPSQTGESGKFPCHSQTSPCLCASLASLWTGFPQSSSTRSNTMQVGCGLTGVMHLQVIKHFHMQMLLPLELVE
jgi:hypothetical protein